MDQLAGLDPQFLRCGSDDLFEGRRRLGCRHVQARLDGVGQGDHQGPGLVGGHVFVPGFLVLEMIVAEKEADLFRQSDQAAEAVAQGAQDSRQIIIRRVGAVDQPRRIQDPVPRGEDGFGQLQPFVRRQPLDVLAVDVVQLVVIECGGTAVHLLQEF